MTAEGDTFMDPRATLTLRSTRQRIEATGSDLSGSTFYDVNLAATVIDDANLSNSSLTNVNLAGLRIANADLTGASITDSATAGMTIDGIPLAELLAAYRASVRQPP